MGSGIFIMGGHLHLARGDCTLLGLAKPPRLLWAVGFLLWEVNLTFPGKIEFLGLAKAADYYGQ